MKSLNSQLNKQLFTEVTDTADMIIWRSLGEKLRSMFIPMKHILHKCKIEVRNEIGK